MKKIILPALALSVAIAFTSCGSEDPDVLEDPIVEDDTPVEDDTQPQEYFGIPSPDEMFAFIKEGGLSYNSELMNPVDNSNNYTDPKTQALNFGIYSADLAYTAAFEEYQESIKYFGAVRKLGDEVGVSSAFNEAMVTRIQNNLNVADSLVSITNDSYFKIIDYLEENEQGKSLAMIAAAGWLESVYIVVNSVKDFNAEDASAERLADQKLIFDNLVEYMKQYESDEAVAATIKDMEAIGTVFENLEEVEVTSSEGSGGRMVLGGGQTTTKTVLGKEQFEELKTKVNELRNSYTGTAS